MSKYDLLPTGPFLSAFGNQCKYTLVVAAVIILGFGSTAAAQTSGTDETANGIPLIYFGISAVNNTSDQCVLAFFEDATPNYEWTFDALKMQSFNAMAVEMALISDDNVMLTIDARPHNPAGLHIPIFVKLPYAGSFTFSIGDMANISPAMCLYVEDLMTGNTIAVETGQSLLLQTSQAYTGNRLLLHASPEVSVSTTNTGCANDGGSIELLTAGTGLQLSVLNTWGEILASGSTGINLQHVAAGTYYMQVLYPHPTCPARIEPLTILEEQPSALSISWSRVDACNQSGNGALILQNNADSEVAYQIFRNDELIWTALASPGANLIQNLTAANYHITSEGACAQNLQINLEDPSAVGGVQLNAQHILCGEDAGGSISLTHQTQSFWITALGIDDTPLYQGPSPMELNSLEAGTYTLLIRSLDQVCEVPAIEVAIEAPAVPTILIGQIQKTNCNEEGSGYFTCLLPDMYSSLMFELLNSQHQILQAGNCTNQLYHSGNLSADVYTLHIYNACDEVFVDFDLIDPQTLQNSILGGDVEVYLNGNSPESLVLEQENSQSSATLWSLSNGYESTSELFEYTFDTPGTYTLQLYSSNGVCSASDSIIINVSRVTSVSEHNSAAYLSFIQSQEDLTFVIHGSSDKKLELAIMDLAGKQVWKCSTNHSDGKRITTSTRQFAHSAYVLMGYTDGEICYRSKVFIR